MTPDPLHQTCRCGHEGYDHEAGECWATRDGVQCPCSWWEPVSDREAPPVIGGRPAREAAIQECRRRIREAAERHEGDDSE